jgi:hypothetical protein
MLSVAPDIAEMSGPDVTWVVAALPGRVWHARTGLPMPFDANVVGVHQAG